MIFLIAIAIFISLYFIIPKGTNLHEILRLPYYNYKAQTARKDEMQMEKHSFGSHRRQYLMLFLPKDGRVKQEQVIVYFHGGGWTFGHPMMFRCNAQFFVDRGYAVVMPTHRRLPFFRSADMQKDIGQALQKTMSVLTSKGLEHKKLILGGLSSGGNLAGLLAYNKNIWSSSKISRDHLAGVMLFASPLDFSSMAFSPVIWRLAGNRNSDFYKKANPLTYVERGDEKPVLLIHGTKDGLVNYKSSNSFIEKRGTHSLVFHTIKNGTHLDAGFWVFEEGDTRKVLLKWLEELGVEN